MSIIEDALHELEKDGAGDALMRAGGDVLVILCPILEQFEIGAQMAALSCCFAMICAAIEGEPVEAEKDGMLIGFEDRLKLHVAEIRAIYKDAYAFRSHPDCPNPIKRM